jgi:uncharacterized protein
MKIALIGASGFVGTSVLNEALNRGHLVTAIVRNPEKITVKHKHLTIIKSDVLKEDISSLITGIDALISTYNAGWKNQELYHDFINGYEAILKAAKNVGLSRLLVVGGAGSLEVSPGIQFVDTPQFPIEWKQGALAARDFLNILKKEQQLNWTFLSPAIKLQPGEKPGMYRLGNDQPVFDEKGECKIISWRPRFSYN